MILGNYSEPTHESHAEGFCKSLGDLYFSARIHGRENRGREVIQQIRLEAQLVHQQREDIVAYYNNHGNLRGFRQSRISEHGLGVLEVLLQKPIRHSK